MSNTNEIPLATRIDENLEKCRKEAATDAFFASFMAFIVLLTIVSAWPDFTATVKDSGRVLLPLTLFIGASVACAYFLEELVRDRMLHRELLIEKQLAQK